MVVLLDTHEGRYLIGVKDLNSTCSITLLFTGIYTKDHSDASFINKYINIYCIHLKMPQTADTERIALVEIYKQ